MSVQATADPTVAPVRSRTGRAVTDNARRWRGSAPIQTTASSKGSPAAARVDGSSSGSRRRLWSAVKTKPVWPGVPP